MPIEFSHADPFSCACTVTPQAESLTANTYYEYRGSLVLPQRAHGLSFCISAHSNYALYIDDDLIGFGQFADYEEHPIYDTLSLPALDAGRHALRIVVYHVGIDTSCNRNRPTSLICQCNDALGSPLFFSSPETLTVRRHPAYVSGEIEMVSGQLGFTFSYDARREADDTPSIALAEIFAPLPEPRPIEKLTVGENQPVRFIASGHFSAASGSLGQQVYHADLDATAPADGLWFRYDLGQETTGILSLDLTVPQDARILIGWGEHLDDGRVRAHIGNRNFACEYIAKAGRNRFLNPFLRLGLRYLEVLVFAEEAQIDYAGVRTTLYPLSEHDLFRCDSDLHNRIYDISLRTLQLCMHEHYEDCPWREQALYAMDSRNQMLCGYYAFSETRFPRASIDLMAQSLRPDHLLELCSPARVSITIPSFSAIFLSQLAEYLDHSGDRDFVHRMLPAACEIADGFLSRMEESGLMPTYPAREHWNFYEWQEGLEGRIGGQVSPEQMHYDAPLSAFISFGLANLSRILKQIGEEESAMRYERARIRINAAINTYYWNEEMGCYASYLRASDREIEHYAELTNALIVYAHAAPDERAERVCRLLTSDDGTLLPVTLSHSIFKYEALLHQGGYHRYVFDKIGKVFGAMLARDATTFWETEKGASDFDNAGSLCHGWSAIPIYLYRKYALNPTEDTGLTGCRTVPKHQI